MRSELWIKRLMCILRQQWRLSRNGTLKTLVCGEFNGQYLRGELSADGWELWGTFRYFDGSIWRATPESKRT